MKCRALLLIAFILGSAGAAFAQPFLPEKITYQEASIQQVIPYRDGVLVESNHLAADSVMYTQFDAKVTSSFKVEGIEILLDAEQSTEGVLFLGLHEKKIRVIEENLQGDRKIVPVSDEIHPQFLEDLDPASRPRLISTSNRAAAIAGDVVWWFGKKWMSRQLPKVPQFDEEVQPGRFGYKFGNINYLEGTTLYAGWDHGEWGGMLISIDLADPKSKWIQLSGKPVGDTTGIPQNQPIRSIISPKKGVIWVATGLAHLDGTWRGLHQRDSGGKWHTWIDGEYEDERGPIKLPFPSSIEGIATDQAGQTYVLAGEVGILRFTKGRLEHMIRHNFFSHSSAREDDGFAYTVGSYPEALGIARNGDVFVSTNNFGVLAFRREDEGWTARQITLNERVNKGMDLNSLPPSKSEQRDE